MYTEDSVVNRQKAIKKIHPTVISFNGEKDAWDKDGKVIVLDESEIDAEIKRLEAEYDANQYQRDRQYPSIGDQLDMLFHDMTASKGSKTGKWYKAIAKVKADNPKEAE
jgi:hypothetical protein